MKIIAEPIDTIFWSDRAGVIRPIRFKYPHGTQSTIVNVDRIINVEKTKRAGEEALVFTCKSRIDDVEKIYELRYTLANTTWVLYKI